MNTLPIPETTRVGNWSNERETAAYLQIKHTQSCIAHQDKAKDSEPLLRKVCKQCRSASFLLLLLVTIIIVLVNELTAHAEPTVVAIFHTSQTDGIHTFEDGSNNARCKKKASRLIYIKTMKTGSSTLTNILYRYALRQNLTVMTFLDGRGSDYGSHYPMHKIDALEKRSQPRHYDLIMEHIYYKKARLNKLMPGKKAIISSVRYPYNQFKSYIHFSENKGRTTDLSHLDETMRSAPGHRYLSVPKGLMGKRNQLKEYLDNLNAELELVFITEYFDASLVLMKRMFCWELKDILYSKLKHGKYKTNNKILEAEDLYKNIRSEEYALYNYFNNTFWEKVSRTKPDFQEEVKHFQQIEDKVGDFCQPYQQKLSTDPTTIMDDKTKFFVNKSKWNKEFSVSVQDCMLMRMHKLAWSNMYTIKNFPSLCNKENVSKRAMLLDTLIFQYRKDLGFRFNPRYCNFSKLGGYVLPTDILALNYTYEKDDYFHPPNITWKQLAVALESKYRSKS